MINIKDKSTRYIDTKLLIYETFENRYITEFEKVELLNILESAIQNDYENHLDNKLNKSGDINRSINKNIQNNDNYSDKKYKDHLNTIEDEMDKIYKQDNI